MTTVGAVGLATGRGQTGASVARTTRSARNRVGLDGPRRLGQGPNGWARHRPGDGIAGGRAPLLADARARAHRSRSPFLRRRSRRGTGAPAHRPPSDSHQGTVRGGTMVMRAEGTGGSVMGDPAGVGVQAEALASGGTSDAVAGHATSPGQRIDIAAALKFEQAWWQFAGLKEQAIKDKFGMSPTQFYQAMNEIIDMPEAMAIDPLVVKRLQRLREGRTRARLRRALGMDDG